MIFLAYTTKYTRYININLYSKIYFFSTIFSCIIFHISTSYLVCTGMSDCIQMSNVYILNKYTCIISTEEMNSINHAVICWLYPRTLIQNEYKFYGIGFSMCDLDYKRMRKNTNKQIVMYF